jgi:hypothetical protein
VLINVIGVFVGFSRIFLLGILIIKGLTPRRLYKSFGVKWLNRFRTLTSMPSRPTAVRNQCGGVTVGRWENYVTQTRNRNFGGKNYNSSLHKMIPRIKSLDPKTLSCKIHHSGDKSTTLLRNSKQRNITRVLEHYYIHTG